MANQRGINVDVKAVGFTFQFDCLILQTTINYGLDLAESAEWVLTVPQGPPYFHRLWPQVPRFVWPDDAALAQREG